MLVTVTSPLHAATPPAVDPAEEDGGASAGSRRPALLAAAWWALVAIFLAANDVAVERRTSTHPRGWGASIADAALFALAWYVLSLGVGSLANRYPLGRGQRARRALLYCVAGAVAVAAHLALYLPLAGVAARAFGAPGGAPMLHGGAVRTLLPWEAVTYALVCLVANTVASYRRLRASEARAARLAVQLADARAGEVEARARELEARLQPHFLFNALHSVMVLMHRDVAQAASTLARLSELLRHALAATPSPEVALSDELAFALGYLEIERVRFADRLTVAVDVAEPLHSARVPRLLLQPLVENAVRHGIARSARPGRVAIRAARRRRADRGSVRHRAGRRRA
jgi:hypothetical protein